MIEVAHRSTLTVADRQLDRSSAGFSAGWRYAVAWRPAAGPDDHKDRWIPRVTDLTYLTPTPKGGNCRCTE
jgi:hypothetical protein